MSPGRAPRARSATARLPAPSENAGKPASRRDALELEDHAKEIGHAPSTAHRIWRAFGLQPHRAETFKLSSDPLFVEKVRDIVGLYLNPPERALVLCVDESRKCRPLTAASRCCPCGPERRTMTTSATGPPRCSRRSM